MKKYKTDWCRVSYFLCNKTWFSLSLEWPHISKSVLWNSDIMSFFVVFFFLPKQSQGIWISMCFFHHRTEVLSFQNNPKNVDQSYETGLDLCHYSNGKNPSYNQRNTVLRDLQLYAVNIQISLCIFTDWSESLVSKVEIPQASEIVLICHMTLLLFSG